MKILTSQQIRNWDNFTISRQNISSLALMERAAKAAADWICNKFSTHVEIHICCGTGNNGSDGFAIARLLYLSGFDVTVYVASKNSAYSEDASANYHKLKSFSGIEIKLFKDLKTEQFRRRDVIIDALFGTGLNRPIEGDFAKLISRLNEVKAVKISIDIPSGLYADHCIANGSTVFAADYTLSFQTFKPSFLHPETGTFCGEVIILDIGLDGEYLESITDSQLIISEKLIKNIYRPRNKFAHKGQFGKTAIVAGSYGMAGAAVLSVRAASVTGSGITVAVSSESSRQILQIAAPEALFEKAGDNYLEKIKIVKDYSYGLGPGIGTAEKTEKAVLEFLEIIKKPVVLDADALNILSGNPQSLRTVPANSILTPHPKEFERLFGKTDNSYKRSSLAREKAQELSLYIVLKGKYTQIFTPEGKIYYNITGNAGMAKGGSGDVLTGILASLLAQGYTSLEAAALGVWMHGKAGDFAAEKFSQEAMLPQNIISSLPKVYQYINRSDF